MIAALEKPYLEIADLKVLLSPESSKYLDLMGARARALTRQYFGNTITLFAPIYLSNFCSNICTYCGFSFGNKLPRKVLNDSEIIIEGKAVAEMGFDQVLLVTGEDKRVADVDYLVNAISLLRPFFTKIFIEVQPLNELDYVRLHLAGVHGILVYQETYNREEYAKYHPKGKKRDYDYRLDTPNRIARADIHRIGLGALLGLSPFVDEVLALGMHLRELRKKFWRVKFSVSLPRLRPAAGLEEVKYPVNERQLLQGLLALRIFEPQVEIIISTRESALFRDTLLPFGVTTLSAGSQTDPGGYSVNNSSQKNDDEEKVLEQFAIADERPVMEVVAAIRKVGLDPVFKDWENAFN